MNDITDHGNALSSTGENSSSEEAEISSNVMPTVWPSDAMYEVWDINQENMFLMQRNVIVRLDNSPGK
jgi:hypothetical protein